MGKRKNTLLEAPEFFELVGERYSETIENPLCSSYKKLGGTTVKVAHLEDPRTGDTITIAPQRKSHFVDIVSEREQSVQVARGVDFKSAPMRLLIEKTAVLLRSGRDLIGPMNEAGLATAQRQISRARPLSVARSEEELVSDLLVPEQSSQLTKEILEHRTLHAAAIGLLRSAYSDEGHHGLDMIELPDEAPQGIVIAHFISRDYAVSGTAMGYLDLASDQLDASQSIELELNFPTEQWISTLDGDIVTQDLQLTVEGNDAFLLMDSAESGFTSLGAEGLVRMQSIMDESEPQPYIL